MLHIKFNLKMFYWHVLKIQISNLYGINKKKQFKGFIYKAM